MVLNLKSDFSIGLNWLGIYIFSFGNKNNRNHIEIGDDLAMIEELKHYIKTLIENVTKTIWTRGPLLVKIEHCIMNFFTKGRRITCCSFSYLADRGRNLQNLWNLDLHVHEFFFVESWLAGAWFFFREIGDCMAILCGSVIMLSSSFNIVIMFLEILTFTILWKNDVFLSPSRC